MSSAFDEEVLEVEYDYDPNHNLINGKYECPNCGKRYKYKAGLRNHASAKHTHIRPYACKDQYCIKSFTTTALAKQHFAMIHGTDRFNCEHCGKQFKIDRFRRSHQKD
eukprot:260774_1